MQTTMRYFLLLLLSVFIACSPDTWTPPASREVGSVHILLADSSLEYLPGDSVATHLVVIVRDSAGVELEGVAVTVRVYAPGIARIFFLDEQKAETTNSYGAVGCVLSSWGRAGAGEVQAQAGGVAAHPVPFTISAQEISNWYLGLTAFPDTLFIEPENLGRDSVRVVAGLSDEFGQAVAGAGIVFKTFFADEQLIRTNSVGQAILWIHPESYGTQSTIAQLGALADTVAITVRRR